MKKDSKGYKSTWVGYKRTSFPVAVISVKAF